jgi:DNA-directed RNA polymerase subunit RPC12/RpoP
MPATRCPYCAQRVLIADAVIGQTVACSRCERTFEAKAQSKTSRLGEVLLVLAAITVGAIVAWLIMRGR